MKRVGYACIELVLVAAGLFAGCINVSNPSPLPQPDYSATFASRIESLGWTPIDPISQAADNVYTGSYRDGTNSDLTFNVTAEIVKPEAAAKERYGQLVTAKQNEGYIDHTSGIDLGSSIFWDVKGLWIGYQANGLVTPTYTRSTYVVAYGYSWEISEWAVVNVLTNIEPAS